MTLIALFLIPVLPSIPSPAPALLTHLTLHLPSRPLTTAPSPFTLTHHLFASTSSLLPSLASTRQYTSLLTLSHTPQHTYVGTTSNNENVQQLVISTSSAEGFLHLLHTKLQPLWSPRQTLLVTDGTALAVNVSIGTLYVRVGDLKLAQRQGQNPGAGNALRGVLLQITWPEVEGMAGEKASAEHEGAVRGLVEAMLAGAGWSGKMDEVRGVAGYGEAEELQESGDGEKGRESQKRQGAGGRMATAALYMEMLRSKA
ncbi:uncharacterized protein HMPREF1541_05866 [Cyphellophora europaea CBS 101466]|uniref:Mediator of RNA polymerase II transcription subunit 20 n=1 Tax=Cyphellophora europaea (strain CBS 101466) TaxID=1220924 RepID=W2RTJ2_CYPE1|nr:uncharacterized protein HMPREF1541_05866 [Cyphellophora europaea CBS 101466]ETN39640.1 hypothetical protein HMPREF1541_05866 [Cyphellophora europaea CBS 101466]